MGKKIDQAFLNSLARIEHLKQKREALHFASNNLGRDDEAFGEAYGTVLGVINKELCSAYEYLFMFGCISLKPEHLKEARRIAFSTFFKETSGIMHYLDEDFSYPGQWLSDEEDEFRAELEAATHEGLPSEHPH